MRRITLSILAASVVGVVLLGSCAARAQRQRQHDVLIAQTVTPDADKVATALLTLHDGARDKDLKVRVVYPISLRNTQHDAQRSETLLPLIVFSHGLLGSGEMYDPLAFHWAANGYVVVQPTHSDSRNLPRKQRLSFRKSVDDWPNRPRDISFVLDSIETIQTQVPDVAEHIDMNRIGVGGHSYGAMTSQLIAGVLPSDGTPYLDTRADGVLLISPQGKGKILEAGAWDTLRGPALTVSGTQDAGIAGEPPPWRKQPFENSPPGTHALVWIDTADHSFGGITGKKPLRMINKGGPNAAHVKVVQHVTLEFWNQTVRDNNTDIQSVVGALTATLPASQTTTGENETTPMVQITHNK